MEPLLLHHLLLCQQAGKTLLGKQCFRVLIPQQKACIAGQHLPLQQQHQQHQGTALIPFDPRPWLCEN
jgi:hypothetical protein